jgi:hypothetical protein
MKIGAHNMKNKILFWGSCILCSLVMGLFIMPGIVKSCASYNARENEKAARQAEIDALVLTEAEVEYWIEVYTAAVLKGARYPAKEANGAILELRKITGGKK